MENHKGLIALLTAVAIALGTFAPRTYEEAPCCVIAASQYVPTRQELKPVLVKPEKPETYTIAEAVADCESGERLANGRAERYTWDIRNKNPYSTASGKYQFLDSTWEWIMDLPAPASKYPESVQDEAFEILWDNGNGASHWNPSRSCWEKQL